MLESSSNYKIDDHTIFSKKTEKTIFDMYRNETSPSKKDKIKRYIASHNMKFVAKTAYAFRSKFKKVPISDLIGYGMLGLFKAIERYDNKRDEKFITYCVWWINQSIISSVQDAESPVRFPSHVHIRIQKKIKNNEYDNEVTSALDTMTGAVSLNQSIHEGSDLSLTDILEDKNTHSNPHQQTSSNFSEMYLDKALSKLTSEERQIIESYFGINRKRQNMEDIGDDLHKSREAIRLKKRKAIEKLKKNPMMKSFYTEYVT